MVKRPTSIPDKDCKPAKPPEPNLEALKDIFMSPPKFVVGTSASELTYKLMVATEGGLGAFWDEAIRGFDESLEILVLAAADFEEERRHNRQFSGVRSANGRVSKEMHDRVVELEQALKGIRRMSKAKVLAGLARLLMHRRGEWIFPPLI